MSSSYPVDGVGDGDVTNVEDDKKKPWKATAAGILSFLLLLIQSADVSANHHPVTWQEWLVTVGGALVTAGTVYSVKNPKVRALSRRR
jgi:hypothetical protein